jgi:hypothetical protein
VISVSPKSGVPSAPAAVEGVSPGSGGDAHPTVESERMSRTGRVMRGLVISDEGSWMQV